MNQKSKWMGRWCPVRATPRHPWTRTRSAKHNIFYLQNDYKVVMKQTEVVLQQLFPMVRKSRPTVHKVSLSYKLNWSQVTVFCMPSTKWVSIFSPGSPASLASVLNDDERVQFNSGNTHKASSLLKNNQERTVNVTVIPRGEKRHFKLVPTC